MDRLQKVIRADELPSYCGLRRTSIDTLIRDGEFPKPVRLSARRKAWLEHELLDWQQKMIARRNARETTAAK